MRGADSPSGIVHDERPPDGEGDSANTRRKNPSDEASHGSDASKGGGNSGGGGGMRTSTLATASTIETLNPVPQPMDDHAGGERGGGGGVGSAEGGTDGDKQDSSLPSQPQPLPRLLSLRPPAADPRRAACVAVPGHAPATRRLLAALHVSTGTLTPPFHPAITEYTLHLYLEGATSTQDGKEDSKTHPAGAGLTSSGRDGSEFRAQGLGLRV